MPRSAKREKGTTTPTPAAERKRDGSRLRDLEKRLAESLEREKATGGLLQTRNRELAEAQEQQTATSEILRVISSSPTDIQPVFDTIVRSAATLCDAAFSFLHRFDGRVMTVDAHHNLQ